MAKKTTTKGSKTTRRSAKPAAKTRAKAQPKKAAPASSSKSAPKKAPPKKQAAEPQADASPASKPAAKATKASKPTKPPRPRDPRLPEPGAVLQKRDRQGAVRCECTVEVDGIRYQGTLYRSLSAAAMAASKDMGLSGRAHNGYLFWGLIKQKSRARRNAE